MKFNSNIAVASILAFKVAQSVPIPSDCLTSGDPVGNFAASGEYVDHATFISENLDTEAVVSKVRWCVEPSAQGTLVLDTMQWFFTNPDGTEVALPRIGREETSDMICATDEDFEGEFDLGMIYYDSSFGINALMFFDNENAAEPYTIADPVGDDQVTDFLSTSKFVGFYAFHGASNFIELLGFVTADVECAEAAWLEANPP